MKRRNFRSEDHLNHVRAQSCCECGAYPSRACHLRIGTDGGMGLKPSDYFTTPMCDTCHGRQHTGERTFWQGKDPLAIIEALIRTSPVRREIEAHRNEN